jgi:serine protease inhibitor
LRGCLQALKKMGVDEPFSDRAQFGRLSPTPLMIDDIYHSVSIQTVPQQQPSRHIIITQCDVRKGG